VVRKESIPPAADPGAPAYTTATPWAVSGTNGLQRTERRNPRNITRKRREREAKRGAPATVRRFNATLSAKGYVWFWPKIAAALTSKHHWLVIACDSCGTVGPPDWRGGLFPELMQDTR